LRGGDPSPPFGAHTALFAASNWRCRVGGARSWSYPELVANPGYLGLDFVKLVLVPN
jgi:hypothetical protein